MKNRVGGRTVLAVLIGWMALAGGELIAAKPTRTITGIVKSYEVYRGKVTSVVISDAQEGKFIVVRGTEIGKELRERVGETVRAKGYVRKTPSGADHPFMIDVLAYEVVSSGVEPASSIGGGTLAVAEP